MRPPFPSCTSRRRVSTLAPPSKPPKARLSAPPILVAPQRTLIDGAFLLLSSVSGDPPPARKAWLGPARQLTRYAFAERAHGAVSFSLAISDALRRFTPPARGTDVQTLGAAYAPKVRVRRTTRLREMLLACLRTPAGVRGLFQTDVVAGRDVIKELMLQRKASFNASYTQGVLFLEQVERPDKLKFDRDAYQRERGFFEAATQMYTPGWAKPPAPALHTLHAVVARSLGGLNLLIAAPVDCVKFKYDNADPRCYLQLVTKQLCADGTYTIRPKTYKEWYLRAHLMGVQSLRLGLVDAAGVLRSVRRLKTRELPRLAAPRVPNQEREGDSTAAERDPEQERGTTQESQAWDPADGIDWAFRVLAALRDYCQEAADVQTYTRSATHPHSNPRPDSPSPAHSNLSRTSPPPSSARPSPHASKPRTRDPVWRVEVRPLAGETRVLVRRLDGVRGLVPPAVARAYAVGYEES